MCSAPSARPAVAPPAWAGSPGESAAPGSAGPARPRVQAEAGLCGKAPAQPARLTLGQQGHECVQELAAVLGLQLHHCSNERKTPLGRGRRAADSHGLTAAPPHSTRAWLPGHSAPRRPAELSGRGLAWPPTRLGAEELSSSGPGPAWGSQGVPPAGRHHLSNLISEMGGEGCRWGMPPQGCNENGLARRRQLQTQEAVEGKAGLRAEKGLVKDPLVVREAPSRGRWCGGRAPPT